MSFRERLLGQFLLSATQLDQLERHYDLLVQWNRKMNLTGIEGPEEIVERHYFESIYLGLALPAGSFAIADIGSGAGFPGIPIAVVRPESQISLIESNRRKAVFLVESSRHLTNVDVISRRVELVESRFDWAVSRAVRPTAVLASSVSNDFALLITARELIGLPHPVSVNRLQWGNDRVVALFHVEHARIDQRTSR